MITSAALSPTGAFKHAFDFLIDAKVESGNAFPVFFNALSPASSLSIFNFKSSLSFTASKTWITDSDNSGPIPSPVMRAI